MSRTKPRSRDPYTGYIRDWSERTGTVLQTAQTLLPERFRDPGLAAQLLFERFESEGHRPVRTELMSAQEMADYANGRKSFAATAAFPYPILTPPTVDAGTIGLRPTLGAYTSRVNSFAPDVEAGQARFAVETEPALPAGGVPDGVAAPEISLTWVRTDSTGSSYRVVVPVKRGEFRTGPVVADLIQRVMNRVVMEMIERDGLSGDGLHDAANERLAGTALDTSISAIARGANGRLNTINSGLDAVVNSGVAVDPDNPLTVFMTSATWEGVWNELGGSAATFENFTEAMSGFVVPAVSPYMPAGVALIGRFDLAVTMFWLAPIELEISNSHSTYFTERRVAMVLSTTVEQKTVLPAALRRLTGM